jgi:hypothetical protein
MKFSAAAFVTLVGSAAAFSGSSFSGTSLKSAASNDVSMTMSVGMGVNGFGRIGRLVTRIMQEDEGCNLVAINAGSATPDYMAYQYKYDTIHGIAKPGHGTARSCPLKASLWQSGERRVGHRGSNPPARLMLRPSGLPGGASLSSRETEDRSW